MEATSVHARPAPLMTKARLPIVANFVPYIIPGHQLAALTKRSRRFAVLFQPPTRRFSFIVRLYFRVFLAQFIVFLFSFFFYLLYSLLPIRSYDVPERFVRSRVCGCAFRVVDEVLVVPGRVATKTFIGLHGAWVCCVRT